MTVEKNGGGFGVNSIKSSKILVDYFGKLAPNSLYDVIYQRDRYWIFFFFALVFDEQMEKWFPTLPCVNVDTGH